MANIPKVEGNFVLEETSTGQTYTDTLYTDNKNISGDIEIKITAKSGNAPVATSLTGTGASASLSGTTITLSKVVTNAGSTFTAGWINSKPTGNATLTLSGTVPTETKTCTPSSSTQTITPSSGKLLSSVVVKAIETESKTVKSTLATTTVTPTAGKYISQVIVSPVVVEEKTVSPLTSTQTITPTSGKDYLSKVVVNAIQVETKSVKSTTATQTITPTSGKFISQVTVNPVVVQSKTATPSTATQTISPDTGKDYLTSVTVEAVTEEALCNLSRDLSASSSAVYYARGPVVINIAVGSTIVGTKAILKETYFMIYSLSVSGTIATLTYRVPKIFSNSDFEWDSYTLTATVPSGSSPTCKVKYASGNLCACASSATTYLQYGKNKSTVSWTGDMTVNRILHNVPPLVQIYCYASHSSAGSGSATHYINAKYCQITSISTSTSSSGYSASTSIQYKYSDDGVNWTSGTNNVAKGGSSSGTISSYCYIYFRYY